MIADKYKIIKLKDIKKKISIRVSNNNYRYHDRGGNKNLFKIYNLDFDQNIVILDMNREDLLDMQRICDTTVKQIPTKILPTINLPGLPDYPDYTKIIGNGFF